jgi:hypothetical protein
MFATIHPFRRGALVLEPLEGGEGFAIVLADTAAGPEADGYRVVDRTDGAAAGRRPLFAQLTSLNERGDPAVAAAAYRGGRERIQPAVRGIDGLVGVLVLQAPDHRILVVALATALETFDAVRDAIMRTELLPGENPAFLPGPDSTELARVVLVDLPAEVRS